MEIKQVLQSRANRKSRLSRPYMIFFDSFEQCISAANTILDGTCDTKSKPLLERSVVITAVTAIEVFYRDMLDLIFTYCSQSFSEQHLKAIHPDKYDIVEVWEIIQHEIHPLELVSSAQSFQNVEKIEKVFSKLLGKSFWSCILELKVSINLTPNGVEETWNEFSWTHNDLSGLKAFFELRHELTHNPARRNFITSDVVDNLGKAASMVFGSDFVLNSLINENKNAALDTESFKEVDRSRSVPDEIAIGEQFFRDIFECFRIPGFTRTSLRTLQELIGEKVWFNFLGSTNDFSVTNQIPSGQNNSLVCHSSHKGIVIENELRPEFIEMLMRFEREFLLFSTLPEAEKVKILEKYVVNKDVHVIRKRPH